MTEEEVPQDKDKDKEEFLTRPSKAHRTAPLDSKKNVGVRFLSESSF